MRVEISMGEVIDKLSILDIKLSKIKDSEKIAAIQREKEALQEGTEFVKSFPNNFWYSLLVYVNTQIWELTDRVKGLIWNETPLEFAKVSNDIFELNQKRFRLKKYFNLSGGLQEQKSYAETVCKISVNSLPTFYTNLARINRAFIDYDRVLFITPFEKEVASIYPHVKVLKDDDSGVDVSTLPVAEAIFEFPTLSYYGNSRLGDVVLSLSICAEHFYKSGRKAKLYIDGNNFKYPLEQTFKDTYPVFSIQPWMHRYAIYKGETIDITFEDCGKSPFVNTGSWHDIYKSVYDIEWGSHPWIVVPKVEQFKDIVFIHSSRARHHTRTDLRQIVSANPGTQFIFLSDTDEEYTDFIQRTACQIPFYKAQSFMDLAVAINSCKLFMGNLSMPNALADALHKERVTMLCGWPDDRRNINMGNIWPMQQHLFN